ncbi:hypothetical protein KJY73_20955 [Bowmanella sp. Y26]|uniref:hypothetical protein n=1 Tax=Bowmanella yangjiangensis TaxID=2811230 RepID=UPI001BDD8362|nr:hypothetical protein [Bowmanella yangjiangensis]MBT1066057.1 hypothetical protein [Bowmanella yangjiangensis]
MFNQRRSPLPWLIITAAFLFGCESLPTWRADGVSPVVNADNLGDYYLHIAALDSQGLDKEVAHQQHLAENGDARASLRLVLLLSLPDGAASNPQLARMKLQNLLSEVSADDAGLVNLLSDQLQQSVQWQNKHAELEEKYRRLEVELKKEQRDRLWLQQQKQSLEQQLQQLKAIERNILKREAETNGK